MSGAGKPEIEGGWRRGAMRLLHVYFRLSRGMTLGVRAACFDELGRVFLVRHTYVPGWYLPGGGVEVNETAMDALAKELREEGHLELVDTPLLFHAYLNTGVSRRDHVLLYRAQVRQTHPRPPDREIAESGFFSLDDLPADCTRATLSRLAEIRGEKAVEHYW